MNLKTYMVYGIIFFSCFYCCAGASAQNGVSPVNDNKKTQSTDKTVIEKIDNKKLKERLQNEKLTLYKARYWGKNTER